MKYIRNYTDLQHFLNSIIPIIPYIELTLIYLDYKKLFDYYYLILFALFVPCSDISYFVMPPYQSRNLYSISCRFRIMKKIFP